LTLGYIFFELSSYKTAIKYLSGISAQFYDYPEALLALGWSAFKLEDYQTALNTLNTLVEFYPDHPNLVEAHFVLGQCYLKLGYQEFAMNEYNKIIAAIPAAENFAAYLGDTQNVLVEKELQLTVQQAALLDLEVKLLEKVTRTGGNGLPHSQEDEQAFRQQRQAIMEKILAQRESMDDLYKQRAVLQRKLEKADLQKKWRSYAEYGRARALFLKGMGEQQ
jgi:tetratricopeptide (TPR) repeat protein